MAEAMVRVLDRLRAAYGPATLSRRLAPVDELVLTILSQNTSDTNRDRAYRAMRERFPTWADVAAAPVADLEEALRPGGLARQKAPRIQAVLRDLAASDQGLDLRWLADLPAEEALAELTAHVGVGLKTASIVLLFTLDVPVMPVDTHVFRVATRLALLPPRTSADRAHALLTEMTPPDRMLEAHLLFIRHGRETCRARSPRCPACPLLDICPEGRRRTAG